MLRQESAHPGADKKGLSHEGCDSTSIKLAMENCEDKQAKDEDLDARKLENYKVVPGINTS